MLRVILLGCSNVVGYPRQSTRNPLVGDTADMIPRKLEIRIKPTNFIWTIYLFINIDPAKLV